MNRVQYGAPGNQGPHPSIEELLESGQIIEYGGGYLVMHGTIDATAIFRAGKGSYCPNAPGGGGIDNSAKPHGGGGTGQRNNPTQL